jgi:hypothetical protein
MPNILFLFVDGVGLGPSGPSNPFATTDIPALERLAGGRPWSRPFSGQTRERHLVRAVDATLGVEGLPQSGTGQGTLFTGTNCAEVVGRHFGPFPHSKTHPTLDDGNLFGQVQDLPAPGTTVAFANAFPPQFFNAARRRATVTTYCCEAAGVPLRDIAALRDGRALTADLSGTLWREQLGLDVPERTPREAAEVLQATARQHSLTVFEYFLTDKAGHARIETPPETILAELDAFVGGLLERLDPARDTLVLTSDHGNLEDTSHTQHTRNPVPLLAYGWAAPHLADVTDLTGIAPGLVSAIRALVRNRTA